MNDGFSFSNYGSFEPGLTNLTATGTTQATAAPLRSKYNRFTIVPPLAGCVLPWVTVQTVTEIVVINSGANMLYVYPPPNGTIDSLAVNAPASLPAGQVANYVCFAPPAEPGKTWITSFQLQPGAPGAFRAGTGVPADTLGVDGDYFLATDTGNLYLKSGGHYTLVGNLTNKAIIAATPPTAVVPGTLWWDDVGGQLYVWYDDGNSQQWIIANSVIANAGGPFLPLSGGTMSGALNLTATGATSPRSVQDRFARELSVLDFGAHCDGTTDDTAAVNAALAAVSNAGGGTVTFPRGTTLMLGAMVIPNNGAASYARQNPLRLVGLGGSPDSYLGTGSGLPIGGSVLDLRYGTTPDGTHIAKIDTRAAGLLEIENLTLTDGGGSNYQFIFTTHTTLSIKNVVFRGNQAHTGTACVQDAVLLGGSSLTDFSSLNATAAFQGYGTRLRDCFFQNIRVAVGFGSSANAVYLDNCTVDWSCGSSDPQGAPFVFLGQGNAAIGNVLTGCIVEVNNYPYAAAFIGSNNQLNTLVGVGVWDQTSTTVAGFYFSATSVTNVVLGSFTQGNIVNTMFAGPGAPYNMIFHGRAPSFVPYDLTVGHNADIARLMLGGGNTNAGDGCLIEFLTATVLKGAVGNYSSIFGGAFDEHLTIYGAGHGISIPTDNLSVAKGTGAPFPAYELDVGPGTGNRVIALRGGNTNAGDGAQLLFLNGAGVVASIGNYSAVEGGAYNNQLAVYAAGHGLILPQDDLTVGNGTGTPHVIINSAASGANAGPSLVMQFGGTQHGYLGGYSSFFGGAYNSQMVLSGYDGLNFVTANAVGAQLDTSHNLTVVGQVTATSMRCTGGAGPSWSAGTGAPSATLPVGSMYSRTDGVVGSTLYVSRGGGTWAAVAGV